MTAAAKQTSVHSRRSPVRLTLTPLEVVRLADRVKKSPDGAADVDVSLEQKILAALTSALAIEPDYQVGKLEPSRRGRFELVTPEGERTEITSGFKLDLETANGDWIEGSIESKRGFYYHVPTDVLLTSIADLGANVRRPL